jgi:hydroxyacylglutathione hydrolase
MLMKRIYTAGLAQVAYLVADEDAGVAAVIDPRRDVGVYLEIAARHGIEIIAALETHVHADFVSGALELAEATGARIYAARLGESEFSHVALDDGDEVTVGRLRLRAFHTPGHTPEHLSYLLYEKAFADRPAALFSGDALFVGEVGRPDLLGNDATDTLLVQLYDTIFERLSGLPDDLVVHPGHGAGSSCGRSIGSEPSTTIGQERLGNYAFRPRSLGEFKSSIMENMPPPPTYYPVLKRVNKVGAPLLRTLSDGEAVTPEEIERAIEAGAAVIDTRPPGDFARAHIPGTLSIGAGESFVGWVGWLAPYDRSLYLVMQSDDDYPELLTELIRIGLDHTSGYLAGGVDAWRATGRAVDSYPEISVHELRDTVEDGEDVHVVDVRSLSEWRLGHIAGADHRYLGAMFTARDGMPDDRTLAFVCTSGYRSNIAASLAKLRGYRSVVNVDGGMDEWTRAGYPIVSS